MFVKICGCLRPEDALMAFEAGADAVGMILVPGRRRTLTTAAALRVRAAIPAGVLAVGVFLDQPGDQVWNLAGDLELDAVQLQGHEPEDDAARLRERYRVIRAWNLTPPRPGGDWLLAEPAAGSGGGTGVSWDWSQARGAGGGTPLLLSGGLNPENVAEACRQARPDGVDVSSGVEVAGAKDAERIRRFCAAARAWEVGGDG